MALSYRIFVQAFVHVEHRNPAALLQIRAQRLIMADHETLSLTVEFRSVQSLLKIDSPVAVTTDTQKSGGLEMLFSDERKHKISIPSKMPDGTPSNVGYLVQWLCDNLMKDPRKELFILDNSV